MLPLNRREFLATTGAAAGGVMLESLLGRAALAQTRDAIKIGFPIPLTGPFGSIATDMQRGATLAMEEINARGGVLGRKIEILFRDDQLKPGVGAQRAKELIENEKIHFMAGVIAAHVQMAVNEQTKKVKMPFFSLSQSDEISAKPDTSPWTFHEAMNPTITSQAVGSWTLQNLGKRWWVLYADYAWGKQNNAGFTRLAQKRGGTIVGSTPYPLGSTDFSGYLPKIQDAKPEVLIAVTPGGGSGELAEADHPVRSEETDEDRGSPPLPLQPEVRRARALRRRVWRDQLLLGAGRYDSLVEAVRGGVHEAVRSPARRLLRLRLQRHHGDRPRRGAGEVDRL